ncbi:hypothetical protein AO203_11560 [Lactobacillus gallinarum]|nr:hypothetical protein AO203_11560 [Lactobacillus gallinarum]
MRKIYLHKRFDSFPITDLHFLSAFHIDNFDHPSMAPDAEEPDVIDSVQGYAIDDDKNIY